MPADYGDFTAPRAAAEALTDVVDALGEVQATPTEFTLLRRLKDLLSLTVLAAGENHVGEVGQGGNLVDVTLTAETSALDAGDVATGTATFTGLRVSGGRALLQSLTLLDEDDQGAALTIVFLRTNASLGTLDAAPDISDTNARDVLGFVSVATADYIDIGGAKMACYKNVGLMLEAATGTDLFVAVINGAGTPTYTASGLKLRLGLLWY